MGISFVLLCTRVFRIANHFTCVIDTFLDPQSRTHATRRLKSGARVIPEPTSSGSDTPHSHHDLHSHSNSLLSSHDPFNLSSTLHSTPGTALLTTLTTSNSSHPTTGAAPKRKAGQRAQPGLPPAHFLVTSGTYTAFFGKSLAGVSGLRGEEVEGDLGECRRKRVRGHNGQGGFSNGIGGSSRRRGGD